MPGSWRSFLMYVILQQADIRHIMCGRRSMRYRQIKKSGILRWQFFPLMTIENHTDLAPDDRVYGYEKRGSTNFIVTSGISDWAIKFKTGCRSEYLMLEIDGK